MRAIDADKIEKILLDRLELTTTTKRPVIAISLMRKIIKEAPTVEAALVVHGKWVTEIVKRESWKGQVNDYFQPYSCSVCHEPDARKGNSKFCSFCGAKMDL